MENFIKTKNASLDSVDEVDNRILVLKKAIGESEGYVFGLNKAFQETSSTIDVVTEGSERQKESLSDYLDLRQGLLNSLKNEVSVLQTRQQYTNDPQLISQIQDRIDKINELSNALKDANFSDLDLGNEPLQELLTQLDMSDPLMANMIRNQIRVAQEMKNMATATDGASESLMTQNDWLMVYGDTLATFADATGAIYERQIQAIEDEMDALDRSYNR